MTITNNRFSDVPFVKSPNTSGKIIDPKIIVMHYTAGYTAKAAIDTFLNKASKVSAHLVLDLDGKITQMVPFNIAAWHAGPSRHKGYENLNNHSIGIEIVNIGYLQRAPNGMLTDAYGNKRTDSAFPTGLVEARNARVGGGSYLWPNYTAAQLDALDKRVPEILAKYGIEDIVSHEEIDTRGWKTDPGPAFPMARYKDLLGRGDQDDKPREVYQTTASILNVRGGNGTTWPVIAAVQKGTTVTKIDEAGEWVYISFNSNGVEKTGWVSSYYLSRLV